MPTYKYFAKFTQRYDLNLLWTSREMVRSDSIRPPHSEKCLSRHAVLPIQRYLEKSFLASVAYAGAIVFNNVFHCRGKQFYISPERLEAFSYRSGARFRYSHDFLIWQKNGIRQRWNAIDLFPVPRQSRFRWKFDEIVCIRHKFFDRFNAIGIDRRERFSFRWERLQLKRYRQPNRWNVIPCDFLFKEFIRFDAIKKEFFQLPVWHQALVHSGWRVVAKNIETEEVFDLGFVDANAENPALEGVFLPDGDYEVSVLTSSLFWKDCLDREIRTISVRPGIEVTPLPTIYNLRSAVSEGVTIIRWSANRSELEDCVFGVWYDSQSPVDTNRPPDSTVWYFSSQTEYATTFSQNAPAWVAIAAMRTGNESETGKVHELYLDWSSVPPRAPDDVVVLDVPLKPFDETVETRHEDDPFWSLWNG